MIVGAEKASCGQQGPPEAWAGEQDARAQRVCRRWQGGAGGTSCSSARSFVLRVSGATGILSGVCVRVTRSGLCFKVRRTQSGEDRDESRTKRGTGWEAAAPRAGAMAGSDGGDRVAAKSWIRKVSDDTEAGAGTPSGGASGVFSSRPAWPPTRGSTGSPRSSQGCRRGLERAEERAPRSLTSIGWHGLGACRED